MVTPLSSSSFSSIIGTNAASCQSQVENDASLSLDLQQCIAALTQAGYIVSKNPAATSTSTQSNAVHPTAAESSTERDEQATSDVVHSISSKQAPQENKLASSEAADEATSIQSVHTTPAQLQADSASVPVTQSAVPSTQSVPTTTSTTSTPVTQEASAQPIQNTATTLPNALGGSTVPATANNPYQSLFYNPYSNWMNPNQYYSPYNSYYPYSGYSPYNNYFGNMFSPYGSAPGYSGFFSPSSYQNPFSLGSLFASPLRYPSIGGFYSPWGWRKNEVAGGNDE